ncbi:MAG: acyl-CoA dehydrogenase C-terminal domain-containing protein, partial [Microthrixaceae bacterium]
ELLADATRAVRGATIWLRERLQADQAGREDALAGATAFLAVFGDLVGGWLLAKRAVERESAGRDSAGGDSAGGDPADALAIAEFYALERLSTIPGRCTVVTAGARRLFV